MEIITIKHDSHNEKLLIEKIKTLLLKECNEGEMSRFEILNR